MAIGCGSAEMPGGFGEPTRPLPGDASDGTDAAGGRSGSSGGSGPSDVDASSDGGTNGSDGGSGTSGGRTSGDAGPSSGGDSSADGGSGGDSGAGGLTDSGGACEPKKWCRDRDGDGYGDPDETKTACTSPGDEWTAQCNDCRDDNALVHPEAECHEGGYTLSDGVTRSYDYDCDGHETECAKFVKAAESGCGVVGPLSCAGGGYLPNPDRTAGAEQNTYCGSTAYRNCVSVGIPCVAQTATKPAIVCH